MMDFQVSKRSIRHGLAAAIVMAASLAATSLLTATSALAQTAPLSYTVPDPTAWSDILKDAGKAKSGRTKATAERKKSAPAPRQAKVRPAKTNKSAAREAFASAPPKQVKAADVSIVSPDELNEIDRMARE